MKLKAEKFGALCLMSAIGLSGLALPGVAAAGAKATVGVANMYLWRGLNLTPDGAQVHGGLS